jgi:hypothetical protein
MRGMRTWRSGSGCRKVVWLLVFADAFSKCGIFRLLEDELRGATLIGGFSALRCQGITFDREGSSRFVRVS